ncbi:alpha/beta fold hydrolase [Engelhardtia mirabilis]|uniref:Dihydrolipoyllysine-residue acetyltransferase component of acetoin cleaving system n=1 Tax=Engelhardtia mirabilis TaxID=2528011 RepID=A0A518BF26_9BACT|nr:Dihydrolipoyllysine-residue acetyltransferase component of acetoin cleaving system [Planctomycetes bacterium Pla133]QDU99914.1 Dihydrolipoyllysine-residue acetyltransferase component of acetoin cleaving system [Planctomycetes bacterium Pla86]
MSQRSRGRVRRGLVVLAGIYAILLLASHVVRAVRAESVPKLGPAQHATELHEVEGQRRLAATTRVVYEDHGPREGAPALVCLHGSPGSLGDFREMLPILSEHLRVITVDLPGFGKSGLDLPDYSLVAHADYVVQLLDQLGLESVHLLGYSMGGGVALESAAELGPRAKSVTLLAGIGVQELELLGQYSVNHAIHGLLLGALTLVREGVPHFGAYDGAFFGVPYARNFYDSDQRPLRGVLERLEVPLLVIHAESDPLVPIAAAREHARIVPQAELRIVQPGADDPAAAGPPPAIRGHLLPFMDAPLVAPIVADFVERVEAGRATDRAHADPARVAAAERPFDPAEAPIQGMGLILACVLIALATLVSEDLTCIAAGAMVAQGRIELLPAAAACWAGILFGDMLLFGAGRLFGSRALHRAPLKWVLTERVVTRAGTWFEHRGLPAIFLTRFMPGMRLPTYFAAGALRANFFLFALYFAIAAGVWTPILVWLSSLIGGSLEENLAVFEHALPMALVGTLLVGLLLVKVLIPATTWRGRRLLVGSVRRKLRWEFWPPWFFYPPVVLYVIWRGLRAGSLTAFTSANPGIPGGGFVGESKAQILAKLEAAGDPIPAWTLLPGAESAGERLARVRGLMAERGLGYPLVIKPDVGQRGSGVLVTADEAEVLAYLEATNLDLIAQQCLDGPEFGVFYARRPGEPTGRVLSITEKQLATVTGDGEHTLEHLILADERAVCMARYYLDKNAERVDDVIAAGEVVALGDLGTHARGAIFLDGARLLTPALEAEVDRIAKAFDGFYFGRFDLRVPSAQALSEGRELRIIELNGVTSEMTHIYDPKHSVLEGYRVLFAQWRLCFEIAAANHEAGERRPSAFSLLRDFQHYRHRQDEHRGG